MRYEHLPAVEALRRFGPLFEQNFRESGMRGRTFRPDLTTYGLLDGAGLVFVVVAFDGEVPAGICSVILARHQHTSELFATNDTLYVVPGYRSTGLGGRLFAKAEDEARRRGAVCFQWTAPAGSPLANALVKRSDLCDQQITFMRSL